MMTVLPFIAFCLGYCGCAFLALSQPSHIRRVSGQRVEPANRSRGILRPVGWVCVLVTLPVCIAWAGVSFAALLWPLIIAVSAFLVALTLAYLPGLFRFLVTRTD